MVVHWKWYDYAQILIRVIMLIPSLKAFHYYSSRESGGERLVGTVGIRILIFVFDFFGKVNYLVDFL